MRDTYSDDRFIIVIIININVVRFFVIKTVIDSFGLVVFAFD